MPSYQELDLASSAVSYQNELYRPTSFWDNACKEIRQELNEYGIENFRRMPSALRFFVPTYGYPGNGLSLDLSQIIENPKLTPKARQTLDLYFSGKLSALSDFRVLLASDNTSKKPYLDKFTESGFGNPIEQFVFEGRKFSRSSLNYLLGLAMLKPFLDCTDHLNVLEIGGGFGTLGEVLSTCGITRWRYVDLDVPPNSFIAEKYLSNVLGGQNVYGYSHTHDLKEISIDSLPSASALCSWQIENIIGKVDLFVNFISFQEMEPLVVENYLKHVNRLSPKWILLRNMREGKELKTASNAVGVVTPITSDDYIDFLPGYKLVKQNVNPYGYRTADGFHSELLLFHRIC